MSPVFLLIGLVLWQGFALATTNAALADAIRLAGFISGGLLFVYITAWPMMYLYLILAAKPLELLVLYCSTTVVRLIELCLIWVCLALVWNMLQ